MLMLMLMLICLICLLLLLLLLIGIHAVPVRESTSGGVEDDDDEDAAQLVRDVPLSFASPRQNSTQQRPLQLRYTISEEETLNVQPRRQARRRARDRRSR